MIPAHQCVTCDLVEKIVKDGDIAAGNEIWLDLCVNCGCIRGGHSPNHPHTRFRICPGFSPAVNLTDVVESLVAIEENLRSAA